MAPRTTRSKGPSKVKSQSSGDDAGGVESGSPAQLPPADSNAPKTFIIPQDASAISRIVSLPDPVNGQLVRYLYCPETGLYEYSQVKASPGTPRSWLLTSSAISGVTSDEACNDGSQASKQSRDDAYVLEDPDLHVATPYDPLFLLTPLFAPAQSNTNGSALPMEDHLGTLSKASPHMSYLLRQPDFRTLLEDRLKDVSELLGQFGVEAYKPDVALLVRELLQKAKNMTQEGAWPRSLEQAYVQKPLEPPASLSLTIKALESNPNEEQPLCAHEDSADPANLANGQSASGGASAEIVGLLRLRVALDYLLAKYIHPGLRRHLQHMLGPNSAKREIDFSPLERHLAGLQKSRQEAHVLRELSDNFSRKRGADNDEAAEARAEKKRKKEEEERKKKQESRALKDLKKTDTSGMKKLSAFFSRGPQKAG